ncbi:sigma-70 family RNA polymerase sigma factor [Acaryochloris sp. CCMEE 5410]|uniref:sigma-70 family RNA polymerase sigma factor n=1 Tax=Acaryochloris sp. CCMEE 5410 TaxID=310037 RepID=UPI0002484849|nr:sigma-70 family RNA polymerase sigma factor [Acaryochloris sp. CCMEE 5410]KAI9129591.1 sigma-70 family RNA polymerase sigma factor [Acaryochloris sp. CCMEE 5410]
MTTATIASSFSDGIRLPEYIVQLLHRFPIPDPEQELELIRKAKRGHENSLSWLMIGHVRLVSKLAKQYAWTLDDAQDLIQEGMLGIRHAVRKFDSTKGCKFSTYARGWIRGYIRRFCYKNRPKQLRLPEKKQIHLDKVYRLQNEFPDASLEEIAQKANLELEYIEDLLYWGRSFQEIPDWHEFTINDESFYTDDEEYDESFDFEIEPETKTNLVLIKAPPPFIPPKYQIPVHLLKQWFRVGLAQFVNAAKDQAESVRLGFTQSFSRHPQPTTPEVGQERVNLSTWPASLSFSYDNSINPSAYSQHPPQTPSIATESLSTKAINLVKGVITHAQESLLVLCGGRSDGPTDRPGHQPSPADQRCRGLGESGTTGRGHLGFGPAVTKFIHRPLAAISDCLRGFPSRAGPDTSQQPQRGAVFDSNPPPEQTHLPRKNAMYRTIAAFIAAWLGLLISPATAETIKIAPGHGHLIDLTSSGCRVSKAYMGTRGIFDLSLDQPQPQTQKIYLTWKPNTQVKSTNLILDLVGCNRSSMELTINRSDSAPSTAITRIGAPTPIAHTPEQSRVFTGRLGQPPVKTRVHQASTAVQPLTLQPRTQVLPKPKTLKRPPVRRLTVSKQTSPNLTAKNNVSDSRITPATLLKGLNIARASGNQTYRYRSEMHWRVNGMIRQMRGGKSPEDAAKLAKISPDQLQTLLNYAQQ